jgi:hypothetical protein
MGFQIVHLGRQRIEPHITLARIHVERYIQQGGKTAPMVQAGSIHPAVILGSGGQIDN